MSRILLKKIEIAYLEGIKYICKLQQYVFSPIPLRIFSRTSFFILKQNATDRMDS